ncbi:MAG: hypothetical protein K4304_05440 [Propionicimonas sp.]
MTKNSSVDTRSPNAKAKGQPTPHATAEPDKANSKTLPWCVDNLSAYQCRDYNPDPTPKKAKHKGPTQSQLRTVAAQLKLPNPTPRFGPDPSVNEWKMLAVGFPIWLWTDRPTTVSTTAHHDGLTFTLTATWTSTTFTMGDGHTKTCTATTIRPKTVKPATKPSPTCGYTYQTKSPKGHPYTVTADTHWRINWTTNGYQGTFNHTYTGNRTLNIGELQSLING